MSRFTFADIPDQTGRTFLITGANTGIGFTASRELAGRGARVLMACRSADKARAAQQQIAQDYPSEQTVFLPLDLSDPASVRRAAGIAVQEQRIDVLVNNAGIMNPPLGHAFGVEQQFGINHLAHFALTGLLLDKLSGPDPRVVTLASLAHLRGDIDFTNLDAGKSYACQRFYNQSKLANILFATELDRRLRAAGSPVKSVCCHPGIAGTELGRGGLNGAVFALAGVILNDATQGALPTLQAATDPAVQGGEYFGPQGLFGMRGSSSGRARRAARSKNLDLARRLWDVSIDLTGIDPDLPPA